MARGTDQGACARDRLYLQPAGRKPQNFALGHCRRCRARYYEPFFAEILRSIESELDRSGQTFILSNHYDQLEKQRTFIDTLLQLGADGVIMSPAIGTPPEDILVAEQNGLPAVLIARNVEGAGSACFPW
jgi:DNA-binding LacI/PurR family transcriptional regulator